MFKSIVESFTNIFKKPLTKNYPAEAIKHFPKYRGLIVYDVNECIFCDKCEKVCPPKAIVFHQNEDGTKEYSYNEYLCIYCGECVRNCPKADQALTHSENKPKIGIKDNFLVTNWEKLYSDAKQSRIDYKSLKKAKKEEESS